MAKSIKNKDYFDQFSEQNINRLMTLGWYIKEELEIAPTNPNGEYFMWLPMRLPYEMDKDIADKLLEKVNEVFNFGKVKVMKDDMCPHILVTNKDNFYSFWEQLRGRAFKNSTQIFYQLAAGIGEYNGKDFKLKTEPKRILFSELYKQINNTVGRYQVLEIIGFYDKNEKPNPANKTNETYEINKIVKELRKDIGLDTKQLVNNSGNLTLLGRKVEPN